MFDSEHSYKDMAFRRDAASIADRYLVTDDQRIQSYHFCDFYIKIESPRILSILRSRSRAQFEMFQVPKNLGLLVLRNQ